MQSIREEADTGGGEKRIEAQYAKGKLTAVIMETLDKQMIENYIEDKPESALFPLLAEQFLLSGDFEKAHEICSSGLSFHPESVAGLFIEARIFMAEGEFETAEQKFKQVIFLDPQHFNGHVLLAECQIRLSRADSTMKKLFNRILEMDEKNKQAEEWLASSGKKKSKAKGKTKVKKKAKPQVKAKTKVSTKTKGGSKKKPGKPKVKKTKTKTKEKHTASSKSVPELKISPEIATFTLVAVLKSQHLYAEALDVLKVMSRKKRSDKDRIKKEREILSTLLEKEKEK